MSNNTQLILNMYKNGIAPQKISNILNIKQSEVYDCLRKNNISYKYNERDSKICELYSNGKSVVNISKEINIDRHTVVAILKRYNIYNDDKRKTPIDSPEKEQRNFDVINLYNSGLSMRKVAKHMNISPGLVKNILDFYNIKSREQHQKGHSKGTSKNRKYNFDMYYFEKIDTEEKAYWLGFLYADGYVSDNGVTSLTLQEKDYDHLLKFKNCLNGEQNIKYQKNTKSYRIDFSSVIMKDILIKQGCVPRKSLALKFPTIEQVPNHLIHHFMRGYFDGDGCIYIQDNYKMMFSVLGTHEFLNNYEQILLNGINRKKANKRTHKKNWNENTEQINYGGKQQIIKIFEFLYKDATIYLNRKYNKFISLLPSQDETDN